MIGLAWPDGAAAQTTRTWSTTSTNPTWSVNTNWSGNTAPVANDSLAFASTSGVTSLTNDITAGTTFNGITFNAGASAYTLSGNSITLGGNFLNNSSNSQTIALPLSLSGTRTFTNNSNTTVTISGNISGAGGLIRDGTNSNNSIVNLTGTNTFTGDITVNAGILQVGGNGVLGTSGTYAGTITLGGATTNNRMVFMSGANQTLTGSIISSTNTSIFFVQNGAPTGSGTVALAAANPDFTSRLIVGGAGATNVATLLLSHSNAAQNAILEPRSSNKVAFASGIGTFNVGILDNNGGGGGGNVALQDTSGAAITLSVGGNNGSTTAAYSGTLSGLGGLTKVGAGTLTLSAANTYTGTTTISAGQLSLSGGDNRLATTAAITITGGVLNLGSRGQATSGAISFQGGTVQSGTLTSTGGDFDGRAGTVSAILAGSVGLTKTTNGTLTLSGSNTYSGNTTVSAGVLSISDTTALPGWNTPGRLSVASGAAVVVGNAVSDASLAELVSTGSNFLAGSAIGFDTTAGNRTVASAIPDPVGGLGLVKVGSNTLTLSSTNAFAGGLSVNNGVLAITGTSMFAGITVNSGGLLQVEGNGVLGTSGTYAGTITISSTSGIRVAFQSDANQTLTGSIVSTTPESIFFLRDAPVGSGTVSLAAANPLFTNRLIVGATAATNAPTLLLSHSNAIQMARLEPRSSDKIAFAPGIGTFNVGSLAARNLAGAVVGGFALTDTAGEAITLSVGHNDESVFGSTSYNGALSGLGGLTKVGSGTMTLSGINTYSGTTSVNAGTLALGAAGSFANSSAIIVGNAGSSGAVLDLTAKTGAFSIGAGQLLGGGGTVRLASSGTLNVLGMFSPGNSPGLFTYDAGTTVLSGTTLMEILGTSRATSPSHGAGFYDAVDVVNNGILQFGGILTLEFSSLFDDNTIFNLFTPAAGSSLAGNFTGVTVLGDFYTGLDWSQADGVWKSSNTVGGQSLEFSSMTGQLVVVPEPGAVILAGLGIAAAAWALRRRGPKSPS